MANFEVDPAPWLPHGHQIIDGGPTRLPQTFYSPSVDPPWRHDSICVAELMPPPGPLVPHWRQQVRNFIEDYLHRTVEEVQPCLFGLGVYRLRSPAARAALVNHIPYPIQNGIFVHFVNHDDRENHRAVQGFRNGWLMFLSIPLDYRNDYDLANAISAFGKLLHWHQDDVLLERTICYVSFPSEARVPRDVVFSRFANVGGVKESWTVVCYILTAEFADAIPHDEDQMPINGNPHPLPGQLMPNINNFVLPQFPELGWNDLLPMNAPVPMQPQEQYSSYKSCLENLVFGPILPKEILLDRICKGMLPSLLAAVIPSPLPQQHFNWVTKCLDVSSKISTTTLIMEDTRQQPISDPVARKTKGRGGKKIVPASSRITRSALKAQVDIQKNAWKKKPRRNSLASSLPLFTEKVDISSWTKSSVRRCTCHMARTDGYKFEMMQDKSAPRKKPRASKPDAKVDEEITPFIPVTTLQQIGRQLEISEEDLTVEKLMANPEDTKSKKFPNED
ncbi:hypothetical protein ACQ4PT_050627 [Festuca glaucescens]